MGKVRRDWIREGIALYAKRLPGLTIHELRDCGPTKEAEAIRATVRSDETLVALMEEGQSMTSIGFAHKLETYGSQKLAFVIGGADGLADELKHQAQWKLRRKQIPPVPPQRCCLPGRPPLSGLVFPAFRQPSFQFA